YDPSTDTWTQKADFGGTATSGAAGFSIGTKGYLGTGWDGYNYHKDIWEYDPATNTWTQKADFGGIARVCAGGFSIGSNGYIGTGYDGGIPLDTKDFWEYTPDGAGGLTYDSAFSEKGVWDIDLPLTGGGVED